MTCTQTNGVANVLLRFKKKKKKKDQAPEAAGHLPVYLGTLAGVVGGGETTAKSC